MVQIIMNPFVKLGLDFGPLVAFFATYKFFDIFVATGALMALSVVTLAITYALTKKIAVVPLVTAVMVIVFGGLTLWLNNEDFIKLKLTIIYGLLASGLLIGLALGKPFAKNMMEAAVELPDWAWRTLTWRIAGIFVFVAVANEIARHNLSTDAWVNFKVWGVPALMFVFFLANAPLIVKNEIKREPAEGAKEKSTPGVS
jgi:intracellular septation protein